MNMWVDDERTPPEGWYWAKTSDEAISMLKASYFLDAPIKTMSLDHDLGGDDTSRSIVLWCCNNDYWPLSVVVHSANPVGREWLEGMIMRYKHG